VTLEPTCPAVQRPAALFDPATTVIGLRAATTRVTAVARIVDVWLYQDPPATLADPARWTLEPPPGRAPVGIAAAVVVAAPQPHVELTLDGLPDPVRYRLRLDAAGLDVDPLRTWLPVRLRPECPDADACAPTIDAPAVPRPSPVDYRARDYRTLRAALVDHLRTLDPEADLSVADPAVTVLELFAHVGDVLHYRLDRVATEAYLATARRRTSVRRHARLVDYRVGDGASAITDVLLSLPAGTTTTENVTTDAVASDALGSTIAFTLEQSRTVQPSLGEIAIHDWTEDACCLDAGATSCVMVRPRPADPLGDTWLAPGDRIVFEVVDPGLEADHLAWARRDPAVPWPRVDGADTWREPLPSRAAHVVELVDVAPFVDPLAPGVPLLRVTWDPADALPRDYPIGIDRSRGGPEVTVARANVVPAHHGRLVDGPSGTTLQARPEEGAAPDAPTTAWLLTGAGVPGRGGAGLALRPDGLPHRLDVVVALPSNATLEPDVRHSLLGTRAGDLAVVVDVDDHEPPVLRFVTGAVGEPPPHGSRVAAAYEVGAGAVGNVPANALSTLEVHTNAGTPGQTPRFEPHATVRARNPRPATGGADPEPLDDVRRHAPDAFAAELRRAVLPADHAAVAAERASVQQAATRRAWSGSWPVLTTAVDLLLEPGSLADREMAALAADLDAVRMIGTEAAVVSGRPVGIQVDLDVCMRPGADAARVRAGILAALRPGTRDRPGLFHPDRLTIGGSVYASAIVAAAAAVPGVDAVELTTFRRLGDPPGTPPARLDVADDEVIVCDDDTARPDRGRIDLHLRGGR
jgi:hypothetical protein